MSKSSKGVLGILRRFFRTLAIMYIGICVMMYFLQDSLLFITKKAKFPPLEDASVKSVSVGNAGETLRGWLIRPKHASQRLIIYYGGNAENVYGNLSTFRHHYRDWAFLLMNYRGYGESTGSPSERNLFSDAEAIYKKIRQQYDPQKIVLMGRSLGSGIAVHVASRHEVQGLLLVTPYDSILNVSRDQYPWLPVSWLLKHPFDSLSKIDKVECPIKILYAGQDRVIRNERTLNLIAHIRREPEVVKIDAGHNSIGGHQTYWNKLGEFLEGWK